MLVLEQKFDDGKEAGFSEGKSIGEKTKQIEIAKNLLKNNIDIDIISDSTGLTIEEINKLNEETTL